MFQKWKDILVCVARIVEGHFYNVVVVNLQYTDADNSNKKVAILPLTCFLVPADSQGIIEG